MNVSKNLNATIYATINNKTLKEQEFNDLREEKLLEFRRFLNIATQLTQLTKSQSLNSKLKSIQNNINSKLRSVSLDDDQKDMFNKMSDAMIELSKMIEIVSQIILTSTNSSVANAVLTKNTDKKLDMINNILRKRLR